MTEARPKRIKGAGGLDALYILTTVEASAGIAGSKTAHLADACGLQYSIEFDPTSTDVFVDRVINAFRFEPQWREHFRLFTEPHATTELRYQDGSVGSVDVSIAHFVQALNDRGYPTLCACEGDDHPVGRTPWIQFAHQMPAELEAVFSSLGWATMDGTVSPDPIRGYNHQVRQRFMVLLDDWLYGELDTTASRYRFERPALPSIPDLPPPSREAMRDHQRQVRRRVNRINSLGSSASFDDLVKLHCGRDLYSSWKLPRLLDALKEDKALALIQNKIRDVPALQRALRWRQRGLDLDLVLRKHEIDLILSRSSENKRAEADDDQ
jgi:hypothetical protein